MKVKNRATRAQLRGSPLKPECRRAHVVKHEWGPDDNRCYCYGKLSPDCELIDDECYACGAFVNNSEPLPAEGGAE